MSFAGLKGKPWNVAVVGAIFFVAYAVMMLERPVDGDEGNYFAAYYEIAHGKSPYIDFYFSQYPTLLYASAEWMRLTAPTPLALRAMSFVCAAGIFFLFLAWCRRNAVSSNAAAILLFLWSASALSIAWLPVIKSFAFTVFLSAGAFVCLCEGAKNAWRRPFIPMMAGVLMGLAVSTRLFYIACIPVALLWLGWAFPLVPVVTRLRAAAWILAGAAVGVLPALIFACLDFDAFWFQTITHQVLRNSESALVAGWNQKGRVAWDILARVQTLVLLLGALWTATQIRFFRSRFRGEALAIGWAVALGGMSFLPTPTYTQYFAAAIPFFVLALRPAAERAAEFMRGGEAKAWVWAFLASYALIMPYEAWVKEIKPMWLYGPADIREWTEIADVLEKSTPPNEPVLTWWSGLAAAAKRPSVPGMEYNFAHWMSAKMTPQQREANHVADTPALQKLIEGRVPSAVVLRREFYFPDASLYKPAMGANYTLFRMIGDFEIYLRQPLPLREAVPR